MTIVLWIAAIALIAIGVAGTVLPVLRDRFWPSRASPPAARDRGARDRRDHRLVQLESRGSKLPTRNFAAVASRSGRRNVELAKRISPIERADVFQVPTRAERIRLAV